MATFDHTPVGRQFDTSLGYFHHENDYYTNKAEGNYLCGPLLKDLWNNTGPASDISGTKWVLAIIIRRFI